MLTPVRRPLLTIRDYYLLPEDGRRWELVEGDFLITPAPSTRHWIVDPLRGFLEVYRLGGQGYEMRDRYDRAGTLRCPDFASLAIVLAPVFA